MIDVRLLRQDLDGVIANLKKRGFEFDRERFLQLEERRRELQAKVEELRHLRNLRSKEIGKLKAKGEEVQPRLREMAELSDQLKRLEGELAELQEALERFLLSIPNLLEEDVPEGTDERANLEIYRVGEPPRFDFEPKDHVELGTRLGMMDFEAAAKITGARFVVLKGPLARLQRALIHFMLDLHTGEHGYQELYVPDIVNEASLYGTGQLPKFRDDLFEVQHDPPWFLIPTAEVPVTNLVREEILPADRLPIKWVAHTPCFRAEAGSYGRETRGMIRQHQFEKVELVQIVHPARSREALEELTGHAEEVLKRLGLPYRKVLLCGGDTGFASAKTYDLEVWLPGQGGYREISSCSNFRDFQARRMKARFRDPETKKTCYPHTLNGSGLAVGRTLVAIMENFQDREGRIHLPKALRPYMGGLEVIG